MKKDITNLNASIRARLQNKAGDSGRPFEEVLQYFAMERFLYRFSQSKYKDKFILKGALMFTVWNVPERRATRDIDFLAYHSKQIIEIEKVMKDVCQIKVQADGLIFDAQTVKGQKIKEDADYEGVRIKFLGLLDRSRIPMQIDVGFGDVLYLKPKAIDYPVVLDLPKPHLKGYAPETVVSEKFDAMVELGALNSRMKDFYDIWLMMRQFEFEGSQLGESLKRTFAQRKAQFPQGKQLFVDEIYDENSDRQILWKTFLKKNNIKHAPESLSMVARDIEKFLGEPLEAINRQEDFNRKWKAGLWGIIR